MNRTIRSTKEKKFKHINDQVETICLIWRSTNYLLIETVCLVMWMSTNYLQIETMCLIWRSTNYLQIETVCLIWRSTNYLLIESQFYWWRKPEDPEKNHGTVASHWQLYHIMLYTLPWSRFELITSVVIGTGCIGSCKSTYHTSTATTAPSLQCNAYPMWNV